MLFWPILNVKVCCFPFSRLGSELGCAFLIDSFASSSTGKDSISLSFSFVFLLLTHELVKLVPIGERGVMGVIQLC